MSAAVTYRDARPDDAAALSALFGRSFTETFGHLYQPGDLAAFLAEQSPDRWADQLADPDFAVRIAAAGSEAVGLIKLGPLKLPVDNARDALELRQLYVDRSFHGEGVAAALMDWLAEEAGRRGARELYLSVYADNHRARRFYARYGFEYVGPTVFIVGDHVDEDVILRRAL
ncbi:GNAT family N-acetyltransferase [Sphingomonas sabuli]|uniref:GNAT family N-acetyltransferase n=1 Tax=Sphingomonas sabuli TaxID=2764186 RepID=A0A7G9L2X3_9SPHN|nr:GNAT family N-acetyltransferase [Sphingomonas sabuli]QNM82972.1 GNAT family N-acetyltransferase [Sphingomonas sabuli]